jgi:hypothetical protein
MAVLLLAAVACAGAELSCSVLLDWTGFAGGRAADGGRADATVSDGSDSEDGGDAASDGAVPIEAAALEHCGLDSRCSPALPSAPGWVGPYALLTGAPGTLPACDTQGYTAQPTYEGNAGLDGGAAQCGCSCGPAQNVGCDPPNVSFYSDNLCNDPCGGPTQLNGCVTTPICTTSLTVGGPTPSAGASCAPDASVVAPPSSWSTAARGCQLPDAGHDTCGAQGFCLPGSAPLCIVQAGNVPCPSGSDYQFHSVFYQGSSDGRTCAPCTCSAPVGTTCAYPAGVPPLFSFPTTGCSVPTGNPYFAPTNPPCTGKLGTVGALELQFEATVTDAGACVPSTPAPAGALMPTTAMTFCCTN